MKTQTMYLVGGGLVLAAVGVAVVLRKPARTSSGRDQGKEPNGAGVNTPAPVDPSVEAQIHARRMLCGNPNGMAYNDQALVLDMLIRPLWHKLVDSSNAAAVDTRMTINQIAQIIAARCPPPIRLAVVTKVVSIAEQALLSNSLE